MPDNICVVFTGGNIGRWRSPEGELRAPGSVEDLLRTLPSGAFRAVDIDFVPLMGKAGVNMSSQDWRTIACAIYERLGRYEGFVVLHDIVCMDFSAAAVAFALGPNLNSPVIFTGSQTVAEVLHGDAVINFLRACAVAGTDLAEVAIVCGGHAFRAVGVEQREQQRFNAFHSPLIPPLADITDEVSLAYFARRKRPHAEPVDLQAEFSTRVLSIWVGPGTEPGLWFPPLERGLNEGIILESSGWGTMPNEGPFSFTEFIERAVSLQKPVMIVSEFPVSDGLSVRYAPNESAVNAGAIVSEKMTPPCNIVKFQWALAVVDRMIRMGACLPENRIAEVRTIIETPYVGEMGTPII
jgi:L-asparaginase/Glu-tRNA(Gln) amidotransferase subunit D